MTENKAIVNSLEEKISSFIALYQHLQGENYRLIAANEELIKTIEQKDGQLKEAQSKYEQLKLAKLLVSGSDDIHDAKLKVNKMVREIDKCIALLNK